jgi:broad specificity phosphatase PhoE
VARAWPAFEAIVAAHRGRAVAIVAHGGTNRALLCRALGVPVARLLAFGQDYAGLSVVEWRYERWSLRRLNERPLL